MLDEIGGENGSDGTQSAQEGGGDAVEAHGRDRGLGALPLLEPREEQHGRAHAGQPAGDGHSENQVLLLLHAAVFCGELVAAGGLQLVAQLGLFQQDPDQDRHQDRQWDGNGHILVVVEQLLQAHGGQDCAGVGAGERHGVGAGGLLHQAQEHIHQIQADPIEHDAGDNLVDVAVGLQQAGDRAQRGAGHNRGQQAHVPGHAPGQGAVEASPGAHHVLPRGANVEQAHLIGEEDGQAAHQQRRRLNQGAAQILQLRGRFGIGHEVLYDGHNGLAGAGGVDDQQHHIAHQQADENAQQRGQQGLDGAVAQQGCFFPFHTLHSLPFRASHIQAQLFHRGGLGV